MKKNIILLSLIFLFGQINLTVASKLLQGMAEIKFEKTVHDFGKIPQGSKPVSYKFKYTNTGSDLLLISRVVKSCGCTEPTYSKEPVMPGQSAIIEVGFTATNDVGPFNKKLTIFTNGETESVILTIKGEIIGK